MLNHDSLHWIGCPCDSCCRTYTTRPIDRAGHDDFVKLLTGKIPGGTRMPVRVRFEVEIDHGGRSLRDSQPVAVTVLAVGEDFEPVPLQGGSLDPSLLPLLLSLLPKD